MGPETSLSTPLHPVKVTLGLLHKPTYAPMIYMSLYVIIFYACRSITWASGRGLPRKSRLFWAPNDTHNGLMPFHRAQKAFYFQGPAPFHLPP
jgi:hypothetical protein